MQSIYIFILANFLNIIAIGLSCVLWVICYKRNNKKLLFASLGCTVLIEIIFIELPLYVNKLILSVLFSYIAWKTLNEYANRIHKEMVTERLESMRPSYKKFAIKDAAPFRIFCPLNGGKICQAKPSKKKNLSLALKRLKNKCKQKGIYF